MQSYVAFFPPHLALFSLVFFCSRELPRQHFAFNTKVIHSLLFEYTGNFLKQFYVTKSINYITYIAFHIGEVLYTKYSFYIKILKNFMYLESLPTIFWLAILSKSSGDILTIYSPVHESFSRTFNGVDNDLTEALTTRS